MTKTSAEQRHFTRVALGQSEIHEVWLPVAVDHYVLWL